MKISTIELSVPQRRLMEIFSQHEDGGDFVDGRIRNLLEYLRELLKNENTPAKTLDEMLNGALPPIDFYGYYDATMRNLYGSDPDCYAQMPDELSEAEYLASLRNCFPKIFLALLSKPVKWVDPKGNLILTWAMGYDRYVCDEVWYASEDTRMIFRIISDYIEVRANPWPSMMEYFLADWTKYLLTREWPDNTEELKYERRLRLSFQEVNAHLSAENQAFREASQDHFITIIDAARAVLRVEFGQDDIEVQAEALKKRIMRSNPDLKPIFSGKLRRRYFPVGRVIAAFQGDEKIKLTNNAIHDAIRAKAVPRCDLGE
jgi:hypothetical protein